MAIQPKNTDTINVNTIAEKTAASGVTIDGVLLKDGALGANTVNFGTSLRGENDTYLRVRNAANSGDLSVLKADASDNVMLNAGTGKKVQIAINGAGIIDVDSAALFPTTNVATTLGKAANNFTTVHAQGLTRASGEAHLTATSGHSAMYASSGNACRMYVNAALQAYADSNGWMPGADNSATRNLGASTQRWARIWVSNSINSQAGDLILKTNSSGSVGVELAGSIGTEALEIKSGTTTTLAINSGGKLLFTPDAGYVVASSSNSAGGGTSAAGWIEVEVNGVLRYIRLHSVKP